MVVAGDFRNGVTFEMDSNVFRVIDFQHVKPGKGAAFVRTKLKNVISGSTIEKTFNPSEKFEEAQIQIREMQYLYNDGSNYTFMDNSSYEQIELSNEQISDTIPFLIDNMNVKVLSYKGNIFGVEPPTFVELEVTYTEPGIKGSTSTGTTKPATVETGASFNVPIFIEIGDKIRIDTRTSQYMERA
ncbi:MAG: elongation factor P [Clostridia bacterium]